MKITKYIAVLLAGIGIAFGYSAFAAQISVPSASTLGQILGSLSSGNWSATTSPYIYGTVTAPNFVATSTTIDSTLVRLTATNATTTRATTTSFAVSGVVSALMLTNGLGSISGYGGTSCTNQFPRSLSALGVATCASVANTDLVSSSITINGSSVSLGGSITVSSTTLLADSNTFSGANIFANITRSTTTQATTTFHYSNLFTGDLLRIGTSTASTTIYGASTSTFAGGMNLSNGGCFAIGGTCLSTSGSLSGGSNQAIVVWTSPTTVSATGSQLTVGNLIASTTATSTFAGTVAIGTTSPLTLPIPQNSFIVGSSSPFFFVNGATRNIGIGTSTVMESAQPARLTIDSTNSTTQEGLRIVNNNNNFFEMNIQNLSAGAAAQSCITTTRNDGTLTTNFGALCQNSTLFNTPASYNVGGAGDFSIMSNSGTFYIAQASSSNMVFMTGGTATNTNSRITIDRLGNTVFGTSSPYAFLSLTNKYGSTTMMFDVASTTNASGSATSSLFNILATGALNIPTSNATSTFTGYVLVSGRLVAPTSLTQSLDNIAGEIGVDQTTGQLLFNSGRETNVLYATNTKGYTLTSTTTTTGTTTVAFPLPVESATVTRIRCHALIGGTFNFDFYNGSASSTIIGCNTTPSQKWLTTNNTVSTTSATARIGIGTLSTLQTQAVIEVDYKITAD